MNTQLIELVTAELARARSKYPSSRNMLVAVMAQAEEFAQLPQRQALGIMGRRKGLAIMKSWHPKLPTSAKARRMLKSYNVGTVIRLGEGDAEILASQHNELDQPELDARFIIGTVAARLCHDMARGLPTRWVGIANQWRKWAEGEAWQ